MSLNIKLPDDAQAKENILEIGRRMYAKNYCAANDGNISVKTADGCLWITPSGVSKGFMTPDMLIKTDKSGNILEKNGEYRISSEIALHLKVYELREDVNAVVHAHPPVSTAFACGRKSLVKPVVTETVLSLGDVPCAPFAVPGTPELAETIVPFVKGHAACLLANHGVLTWGSSAEQAYFRLETTEYYANMLVLTGELPVPVHVLEGAELAGVISRREGYGIKL